MNKPKTNYVRTTVLFPPELHAQIKALGEDRVRSFGQQVVYLCKLALVEKEGISLAAALRSAGSREME